jgi:hypothetical protein
MSDGALLNFDDKLSLALNLIGSLLLLVSSQPFIGPFANVLERGIKVFEDFRTNKANAKSFQYRLCDVVIIVDETIKITHQGGTCSEAGKMDLIKRIVEDLREIVIASMKFFEAFNKKGFLGTLMAGTKASDKFADYDKQITTKLNDLTLGLGIHQHHMAEMTFQTMDNIENLLQELGGMKVISNDVTKLNELAQKLGTT